MFNRLKDLNTNYVLIAFLAFMVKMLVVTPSPADSIIVAALGAVYGYTQYLKRFQPYKLDDVVMNDLKEVKMALSKLKVVQTAEKMTDKKYF